MCDVEDEYLRATVLVVTHTCSQRPYTEPSSSARTITKTSAAKAIKRARVAGKRSDSRVYCGVMVVGSVDSPTSHCTIRGSAPRGGIVRRPTSIAVARYGARSAKAA